MKNCCAYSPGQKKENGFTLIELMITVAIVGILAAVALPSYNESIKKSRRVDMQRALGEAEQYMRRYYGAKDTFVGATLPAALTKSPREGGAVYDIALGTLTVSTFTITATRTSSMLGDKCGNLSVSQTGGRTMSSQNPSTLTLADCFKGS